MVSEGVSGWPWGRPSLAQVLVVFEYHEDGFPFLSFPVIVYDSLGFPMLSWIVFDILGFGMNKCDEM